MPLYSLDWLVPAPMRRRVSSIALLAEPGVTLILPKASAIIVRLVGPQLPFRAASSLVFEALRYCEMKLSLFIAGSLGVGLGCGFGWGFGWGFG
ncbi:hypothetical protein D3C85_1543220 [compost metagenome]